jgi:hypothetical protein
MERNYLFPEKGKANSEIYRTLQDCCAVGAVAYRLELPDELSDIHPTFHVSHLRKCLTEEDAHAPLDDIKLDERLNYEEEPIAILDRLEKQLSNKTIRQVKIQLKHRKGSEATCETEKEMKELYPQLFVE